MDQLPKQGKISGEPSFALDVLSGWNATTGGKN
jgi:hypothetical protein